ncbi:MAG TPA: hypothetical protein P5254_08025, partial [Aquihabitans sp.]|nr:hypothetical protein [Aquihabitans sp.]
DPVRRALWITYAAATMVTVVVALLAMSAANRERGAAEVMATVLDGRGTAGDDAELLLRIPVPAEGTSTGDAGDAVERWVATDEFRDETVGSRVEVHLPTGDVEEAHLARDCTCGPLGVGDALPFATMLAVPALGMAWLSRQRRRAASELATAVDRQPVRLWWAGGSTGTVLVFDRHDRWLGSLSVPPSTRVALPDGSSATLVGRAVPGSPVALDTAAGPILPTSSLAAFAPRSARASGRHQAVRVPAPATVGTGVAAGLLPLLLLVLVVPVAPAPWPAVGIGLVGATAAALVAARLGAWRRGRTATEVARAAALSAPPMPPLEPTGGPLATAGSRNGAELVLGGDRPLEAPGRFFGFALTLTAVSFVWFFLLLVYWPLTALALVDGVLLVVRSPRPVRGRIARPALPLLTATAVGIAGGWAWLASISSEDWDLPMLARVPLVVASIPLALLAWRMITVGVTVGARSWYVRNVASRFRFDACDVVAVRVGEGRRPGGLEIALADGRTVRASRFAVSRRGARRLVDQLDLGTWPSVEQIGPAHPEGPLIGAARGPFWRG